MADRKTTFWYGRAEPGYVHRYELTVGGTYDLSEAWDQESLIEQAANDYHSNRDGWEAHWPLTFEIAETEDGPALARFEVELEWDPTFHASHQKEGGQR